ncbi:centrosomal protein of 290 kDa [Clupea harengus]|uniref:Centrosomal protein of 290 kDa n=1 Tax=Clupea harengus TaxID=7950 RepID=A0A6P8F0L0_CLUHA|nr:centrosomal protein of 290 kDa [Clupea harengus]
MTQSVKVMLDWNKIGNVDPEELENDDEELVDTLLQVEQRDIQEKEATSLVQLFRIAQSLLKIKCQELSFAYEMIEKAGVDQARLENAFQTKVSKLESELKMVNRSAGGRDTRFLRDEIRQLEGHLERKEKELVQLDKEMMKERKTNEELSTRVEGTEDKNRTLRRENDQLRQDVEFYRRELEQRVPVQSKDQSLEAQRRLTLSNRQLYQCMEDLQRAEDETAHLKTQSDQMQKNLEESVKEMEKMTDEYNKMKIIVQQSDSMMDQLRRDRDHAKTQVRELMDQIQRRAEEDDPVMAAVSAKVEEWKRVLSEKDDEVLEYQRMNRELRDKLRASQMDTDKNNLLALQQAVQERDHQIKMLSDQVEQYTNEMEKNTELIEELKKPLRKERGPLTAVQLRRMEGLQTKVTAAERKALEAEHQAELAEKDARLKDKELSDTLTRIRVYESGTDGLGAAIAEIKECKNQTAIRDAEARAMTREINTLEMRMNDLLDQNEALRERLGLNQEEEVDLTEFRRSKALKQRQYKAENQVLMKEIERLEEDRLDLKMQLRAMVKEKGMSSEPMPNIYTPRETSGASTDDHIKTMVCLLFLIDTPQNEHLRMELNNKQIELELKEKESSEFKAKFNEMLNENKHLEEGIKEILGALQDNQQRTHTISVPCLERLVTALEMKNTEGAPESSLQLKMQVDTLTGRNHELRQEMRGVRDDAAQTLRELVMASEKVMRLESELETLRKSNETKAVFKAVCIPEELTPSNVDAISSLNDYAVHLLLEVKDKEDTCKRLQVALKEYRRKLAVIRHQQGLLYEEYQSEREAWQKERESLKEAKNKLEEQRERDEVKIKEFTHWLEVLEQHPTEIKRGISEASRKMTVLRVNEKSLTRYCTTLLELEQHLRKENNKLKDDSVKMEMSVTERMSYLQRYKDMAVFKIAALQKALDNSVPSPELEKAHKQYINLTVKYRDLLQKDNHLVQRATALEHLQQENVSLHEHISALNKELHINRERIHVLEQAWDHTHSQDDSRAEKATMTNGEIVSVSKKMATLEMKELNERQRAEHAQRMYEQLRDSLRQVEQRNLDLENKFVEVTKQNLDSQRVEQELRDELANSVSAAVNDRDQKCITDHERTEAEMKMEISKLQEVANVAKMQVSALEARQLSREKEIEALRRQTLEYQAQSDEKALIAKLYQHIVALQLSETTALCRLESTTNQLRKLEAQMLRAEQQLDEKEKTLWYVRHSAHGQAKHLRQTIQLLRRQFCGALPLAQQERSFQTMRHLQEDRDQVRQEALRAEEQRRSLEGKAKELELKLKGLEDLTTTLKDSKGAQKVIEWHKKLEESRLLEMKRSREVGIQKEEIRYLRNVVEEQERSISALEDDHIQERKLHEERQLLWEGREVEFERQMEHFEKQQNELYDAHQKTGGALPDPTLPLSQQLNHSLTKIKELVRAVSEKQATCNSLEEKLKERDEAFWKSEQNVLSRDKVINELRLRLPAVAEKEKILANLSRQDNNPESQPAFKVAQQTINSLQGRLNQKEEVLKKYQHLLSRTRQEQEDIAQKHKEDMQTLQQKLETLTEASLGHLKQTALDLMKKPFITIPTTKHLARLAELEQTVAEQENSLTTLMDKLKVRTAELDKQRHIMDLQTRKHDMDKDKLEGNHSAQKRSLEQEAEELRAQAAQMADQLHCLQTELDSQREANVRAPSQTMKNLVDSLKAQLCLKEKQQRALSKALQELRAEMTSHAEQQIIANVTQREENFNIQQIVDKHTKELQGRIQELSEELLKVREGAGVSQSRESSMRQAHDGLMGELQKSRRAHAKLQAEKALLEDKVANLKQRVKALSSNLQQSQNEGEGRGSTAAGLRQRISKLETELDRTRTSEQPEGALGREEKEKDKMSKEEMTRWDEGKRWHARLEKIRNTLKEKEREVETLSKQLNTIKDLYTRVEGEKIHLQKKLSRSRGVTADQVVGARSRGVTADQVVGARSLESDKEIEELRRRNSQLERQIQTIKQQQALPRDAAIEDMHLRNRYLEDRILCLETQLSREASTLGPYVESPTQKEHKLQEENLRLSSKNLELCFQLEQATKDLPRLKDQVSDLKDMCNVLIKEKAALEAKLGHIRKAGGSGKTAPELEKTIGLMKKVVERVQRENEALKKVSAPAMQEQLCALEQEHDKLKAQYDQLKGKMQTELKKEGWRKL